MNIGEKIKSLRCLKKLTLEELAGAVGTTKQTIHKYETGIISNIPASKIKAIADKLDTTPAYLMGWTNISNTENEPEILKIYNSLNTLGKAKANEYITDLSEQAKYTKVKKITNTKTEKIKKNHDYEIAAWGADGTKGKTYKSPTREIT